MAAGPRTVLAEFGRDAGDLLYRAAVPFDEDKTIEEAHRLGRAVQTALDYAPGTDLLEWRAWKALLEVGVDLRAVTNRQEAFSAALRLLRLVVDWVGEVPEGTAEEIAARRREGGV